jgi:hypothetical protein
MQQIVDVHFPDIKSQMLAAAMRTFFEVRNLPGLKKKPSTSELLDWLKLLLAEDIPLDVLQSKDDKVTVPPLVGALLKNEQDVSLFEKLVFMQRNNR